MAYIYLSEEKMKTYIQSLKDKGNAHQAQVNAVNTKNKNNGDDADIADHVTPAASMTEGATVSKLSDVDPYMDRLASELKVRLDNAIAMNSSGVTIKNDDGMIAYYLPDEGAYSEDTVANVKAFNNDAQANAKQDATALDQSLKSPDGVASDGRTTEQILEEMSKHQDVPAYSVGFVNTYGVEGYLDLPQRVASHYTKSVEVGDHIPPWYETVTDWDSANKAVGILGSMFAAASQPEVSIRNSQGKPVDLVDAVETAVESKGHYGRISGLNALFENTDATFGTDFLVELATRFEDNGYDGKSSADVYGVDDYGGVYGGSSMDPMAGVLTGMGRNPKAALTYLVPDGKVDSGGNWSPGSAAKKRWELLSTRTWDPQNGMNGFTAALGGASSYRVFNPDGNEDERAAWITGKGMDHLVAQEVDYTSTAKKNIAIMLGNSLHEMEHVAGGDKPTKKTTTTPLDDRTPALMTGDHSHAIKQLTSIAGTDDEALTIMGKAVGRQSTLRTQATIDAYPDAVLGEDDDFMNDLTTGLRTDGQLLGFIEQSAVNSRTAEATQDAKNENHNQKVASTMLGGLSTGLSAIPNPYTQVAGAGLSIAAPLITEDSEEVSLSAANAANEFISQSQRSLEHSAVAQLANNGHLPEDAYVDRNGVDFSEEFAWMNSDHSINTRAALDNPESFERWLKDPQVPEVELKGGLEGGVADGRKKAG